MLPEVRGGVSSWHCGCYLYFMDLSPHRIKSAETLLPYVRLSVGTKTHLSKVRQLGVQPKTKEAGAPTLQGKQKVKGISLH